MIARTDPVRLDTRLALRPKEAAEALGICERTLRQLTPRLPVVRIGRRGLIYPVQALRQWLDEEAKRQRAAEEQVADEIAREMCR
ncbi:helix-turn-helix domain-containing protein [Myxococcota bacterium]|nr:helix-turn-helix domain-containing protein [Myxococcota bacterium]